MKLGFIQKGLIEYDTKDAVGVDHSVFLFMIE